MSSSCPLSAWYHAANVRAPAPRLLFNAIVGLHYLMQDEACLYVNLVSQVPFAPGNLYIISASACLY